jgi:hypothetical protein
MMQYLLYIDWAIKVPAISTSSDQENSQEIRSRRAEVKILSRTFAETSEASYQVSGVPTNSGMHGQKKVKIQSRPLTGDYQLLYLPGQCPAGTQDCLHVALA